MFIIVVPYCYVKIYYFRKNLKIPGNNKDAMERNNKKRNIVTFTYNMLVWIIEALSAVIVRIQKFLYTLCDILIVNFNFTPLKIQKFSIIDGK